MAAVQPDSLVLVTGINGHVASTIALRLLQHEYRVRGTVRQLSKASFVRKEFTSLGIADKFEVVEVPDVAEPGAFDSAVKGVDAIAHVSSPTTLDAKTSEEQFIPAVGGMTGILTSANREPSVKRVIFMSTIGTAILSAKDLSKEPLTGEDWNTYSEKAAENAEDPARAFHIYCGSKVAAEKAAFRFMTDVKPAFTFTVVLGPFILGPIHKAITPPGPRLDVSLGQFYATFANPPVRDSMSPIQSTPWVHVYDVADLFIASLTSEKTASKRLMAVAGRASWAEMGDIVRKAYPDRPYPPVKEDAVYVNFPGADTATYENALETELLGGKWRTLEDTALGCAKSMIEKEGYGWDKDN